MPHRPLTLALVSALITIAFAGVHHIFRLGPEFIVPTLVITALELVAGWRIRRSASKIALWALVALNSLIFVWFGVIDGILDHVLKALGLDHITLLPGGEEEIVDTYFQLGSVEASSAFYEWTGVGEGVASIVMMVATVMLVAASRKPAR